MKPETVSPASLCSCDRIEFWQPYANHDAGSGGFLHHSFWRQEGPFRSKTLFVHNDLFCFRAAYLHLLAHQDGAGAAMHWGTPDSLDRFIAHVTAQSHRSGYV